MNIFPPIAESKKVSNKIDESIVYSKDGLFWAAYLDNGRFSVCIERLDMHVGIFKVVCSRWVFIDDFCKMMDEKEKGSIGNFLAEFSAIKS